MSALTRESQAFELGHGGRWRTIDGQGRVAFQVMTLWGLASVTGVFERYRGELTVGAREISAELTIDAASLATGSRRRDRRLRSAEFFDVEHHPELRFRSGSVQVSGDGLLLEGELTIGSVTQTCRLEAELQTGSDGTVSLRAATVLDRAASGLGRNRLGMLVGDAVVSVELELAPT